MPTTNWRAAVVPKEFIGHGAVGIGRELTQMDQRNITRILLEGALNGIGFVIGSAIVGFALSGLLVLRHHVIALVILPASGIVFWLCIRGRRAIKARLERIRAEQFTRALGKQ